MPLLIKNICSNFLRTILLAVVVTSFFFLKPSTALGSETNPCTCNSWVCTTTIGVGNGWYKDCECTDYGSSCTQGCQPGYYVCNQNGGGCCPIGDVPTGGGSQDAGSCSETPPSNLVATRVSNTSATLSWTPGTSGGGAPYQALWVSTNPDPYTGCAGSTGGTSVCPVRKDYDTVPLDPDQSSYDIDNLLTPGTLYYWEIMNFQDSSCYQAVVSPYISSCELNSSAYTLAVGGSQTARSSITSGSGIQRVGFSSNATYVNVANSPDWSYAYQTLITGVASTNGGTVNLNTRVYLDDASLACSSSSTVAVTPPQPWWQIKDSDVSSNGDLTTNVPDGSYFDLFGDGLFPGIPSASGTTDLDGTNVSNTGWFVDSAQTNAKVYDHAFFNNQIPKDTVVTTIPSSTIDGSIFQSGGTLSYGYYWYKYDGTSSGLDLTITAPVNIGSRKVILLVDSANLYINGSINLTDGQGFFMTTVGKTSLGTKGGIIIDPAVGSAAYDLEGIYQADGTFNTGVSTLPLSVRGSVAGYDGITMNRDLGDVVNGTTPAEFYEYAPDQIMLYPSRLGSRKINWKEVAP